MCARDTGNDYLLFILILILLVRVNIMLTYIRFILDPICTLDEHTTIIWARVQACFANLKIKHFFLILRLLSPSRGQGPLKPQSAEAPEARIRKRSIFGEERIFLNNGQ